MDSKSSEPLVATVFVLPLLYDWIKLQHKIFCYEQAQNIV